MTNHRTEESPRLVHTLPTPVARRFEGQVAQATLVVEALPSTPFSLGRSRMLELLSTAMQDDPRPARLRLPAAPDTPADTDEDQPHSFVVAHERLQTQFINFYAHASNKALSLLALWNIGTNASYSATGAAILKSQEHTYNTLEAATAAAIGTILLSSPYLYLERIFAIKSTPPHAKHPYALTLMRWSFLVAQPALGLVVLQQLTGVEMSVEQNMAAYFTGAAILCWPYSTIFCGKILPNIYDGGGDLTTGPTTAADLEPAPSNTAALNSYAALEEGNNSTLTAAQLPLPSV